MIRLEIEQEHLELELHGSDALILEELSTASARILHALEHAGGRSSEENLTYLILQLIEIKEQQNH